MAFGLRNPWLFVEIISEKNFPAKHLEKILRHVGEICSDFVKGMSAEHGDGIDFPQHFFYFVSAKCQSFLHGDSGVKNNDARRNVRPGVVDGLEGLKRAFSLMFCLHL